MQVLPLCKTKPRNVDATQALSYLPLLIVVIGNQIRIGEGLYLKESIQQTMEKIILENDIKVRCVAAKSFPDDVLNSHQTLHSLVPFSTERNYFGVSRMENGKIIYKAAAEELESGELAKHDLEELVLPAGTYQSLIVKDFMKNIQAIGAAFDQLIQLPDIDPEGYCIEWYLSDKDVRCMVRVIEP